MKVAGIHKSLERFGNSILVLDFQAIHMNPTLELNYPEIHTNQMNPDQLEKHKCLELLLLEIHKNLAQQTIHSMYFEVFPVECRTNPELTEHCQSLIQEEFHMNQELVERHQLLALMEFHTNLELTEH